MYKFERYRQLGLADFNQPVGLKINPEKYAKLFPSKTGMPAKPLRMALGALLFGNSGTLILDATCAPQNISFPQDVDFLNKARENPEGIVDDFCGRFDYYNPRSVRSAKDAN